jgi:hypothetical protein
LIRPADSKQGEVLVEDPGLKLDVGPHWALLSTPEGIAYAIPTTQVGAIQRVDEQELTPHEE